MPPDRRSSVEDRFFDELKDWSEIKLRILEKYLGAYMNKRGGSNPKIYYIDGFAGPGYYGRGGADPQEGSPVRMARFAQKVADAPNPGHLICLYTEARPEHCRDLKQALSQFNLNLNRVYCGAFRKQLPTILRIIQGAPAIFFLDPFGVKHIAMDDLGPLLQRRDTELLLNFNTPRLRKLAGFEDSSSKDAKGKLALVSRVLGDDPTHPNPTWLVEWRRLNKDGILWERWAVENYIARLLNESPYLRYARYYPVRETYGANPKYYLIFATRREDAIVIMNDFVCSEDDALFTGVGKQKSQLGFFDMVLDAERQPQLKDLLETVHDYGLIHQGCNRDRLIKDLILQHFGEFKQKHYRQAVDKLVESGRAVFGVGPKASAPIRFL